MLINKEELSRLASAGKVKDLEGLRAVLRVTHTTITSTTMTATLAETTTTRGSGSLFGWFGIKLTIRHFDYFGQYA
jgi:hypothetical protein